MAGLGLLRNRHGNAIVHGGSGLGELRQPEIQDLDAFVVRKEQVFRFEVTMNNSGLVRGGQPVGNLDAATAALRGRIGGTHRADRRGKSKLYWDG